MLYFADVSFPTGTYHASELEYIFDITQTRSRTPDLIPRSSAAWIPNDQRAGLDGFYGDERPVPIAAAANADDGVCSRSQVCVPGF